MRLIFPQYTKYVCKICNCLNCIFSDCKISVTILFVFTKLFAYQGSGVRESVIFSYCFQIIYLQTFCSQSTPGLKDKKILLGFKETEEALFSILSSKIPG